MALAKWLEVHEETKLDKTARSQLLCLWGQYILAPSCYRYDRRSVADQKHVFK